MITGDRTGHRTLTVSESGTVDHLEGGRPLLITSGSSDIAGSECPTTRLTDCRRLEIGSADEWRHGAKALAHGIAFGLDCGALEGAPAYADEVVRGCSSTPMTPRPCE
jgi:hypothetical protein